PAWVWYFIGFGLGIIVLASIFYACLRFKTPFWLLPIKAYDPETGVEIYYQPHMIPSKDVDVYSTIITLEDTLQGSILASRNNFPIGVIPSSDTADTSTITSTPISTYRSTQTV